jgi:hypothetical protein
MPDNLRGWIWAGHTMVVDNPNLGTYTAGDLNLTAASARKYFREEQGECYWIRPIFFYDTAFIYLIDVTNTEAQQGEMYWDKDQYLSIVQHPVDPELAGVTEGNEFVLRWGVPNAKVVLTSAFLEGHMRYTYYQMTGLDSDVADIEGDQDDVEVMDISLVTVQCRLREVSMGDCYHIVFDSCGDFGNAITDLSVDEKQLWDDLAIDKEGEVATNPKYASKTFKITFGTQKGNACGDPSAAQDREAEVQIIKGFRLVP